jgi:hypothetical protein
VRTGKLVSTANEEDAEIERRDRMSTNVTKEEIYQVEYHYYQFNSGLADNGYRTDTKKCRSAEEAVALAGKINAAAAKQLDEEETQVLADDLIPYAGTFEWAKAYHVVVEKTLLG